MKFGAHICVAALLWSSAAAAPETPLMPAEVTLTSGRVLRNVQVVRWERDRVVLKYSGGVDPIAFSLFKSPAPTDLPLIKRAAELAAAAAAKPAAPKEVTIGGQVFVTTKGAGAYKFAGAHVRAYDAAYYESARDKQSGALPGNFRRLEYEERDIAVANAWAAALEGVPLVAESTTDAEGFYSITLPGDKNIFIVCLAGRTVGRTASKTRG